MKRRGGVADWGGGVLPGNLEMGKVQASTYFSHGPSRSSGPPGSSEPPEPSGSPEPSGHPDPDSLQLELVLPQRYSTGAYGSIEATNFKVLLKNTWPFLVVESERIGGKYSRGDDDNDNDNDGDNDNDDDNDDDDYDDDDDDEDPIEFHPLPPRQLT